ncbi:hypothetical protein BDQ17DRAFT_1340044 [Cyathus striatus]|nr:hypothetical protein BDQ17DRAFT_1340044 [Cyathus striatus]
MMQMTRLPFPLYLLTELPALLPQRRVKGKLFVALIYSLKLEEKKRNASGSPLKTSSHCTKKATVASESDNDKKTDTDVNEGPVIIDNGSDLTYARLRAMADADSQKSPHCSKEELTADIRTMFQQDDAYQNPLTGQLQKGHQCKICFQNKSKSFFFTGGISTLHTHIARWHSNEYLELCKKLGITPHPCAMPKNVSEGSLGDGAQVNRTTLCEFQKRLSAADIGWTAEEHDILCTEHALNLATKHFISAVDIDIPEDAEDEEELNTFAFTAGDSLGKALALVKQNVATGSYILLFNMCSSGHQAFRASALDSDSMGISASIPQMLDLFEANFRLSRRDWEHLEILREVLHEPSEVQQTFSDEKTPTVWRDIPALEFLIKCWNAMIAEPRYQEVKDAMAQGVTNLQKWYHHIEDTSSAYFICLALDPNVKHFYCKAHWEPRQYQEGMKYLERVFDTYYILPEMTSSGHSDDGMEGPTFLKLYSPSSRWKRHLPVLEMS